MSRLCRLRNASHGDDGQWAYSEIVGLREQVEKLTKERDERIAELEQDLQTTADALAEVEQIRIGLKNVRLFAARHRKEDWALLILDFCSEAGVFGSVLR